jgi:RNA polymerase sigma-70 factor (ECF subfamily)
MPNHTDEALMAAWIAGDQRAFRTLFDRYAPRLHAFFARSCPGLAAEDLVQATFLRFYGARARFRLDLPLRPFLYSIAARVRTDELRRRYRQGGERADPETLASSDDPEQALELGRAKGRVRRAIDELAESQRVVVWLHRFEGLSFSEIAAALTELEGAPVSEGAARVRAFRAYDSLRKRLEAGDA